MSGAPYTIGSIGNVNVSSSSGSIHLNSSVQFNHSSNAALNQLSSLSLSAGHLVGYDGSALVSVDASSYASASDLSALQTTVSGIASSSGVLTASNPLAIDGSANIALAYSDPFDVVDNSLALKLDSTYLSVVAGNLSVSGVASSSDVSDINTNLSSNYITASSISSTYLSQSDASSTYLNQSDASSTYLSQSNASSTYALQSAVMPLHPQVVEILPSSHRVGLNASATPANSNTVMYSLGYIVDSVIDWYSIELANVLTPANTTVGLESVIYFNLTDASNVNTKGYIKYECMFDSALLSQEDPNHINNSSVANKIIPSENMSFVPNNSDASTIASQLQVAGYDGGASIRFNNRLDGTNPLYTGQIYVKNYVSSFGKSA